MVQKILTALNIRGRMDACYRCGWCLAEQRTPCICCVSWVAIIEIH